MATIFSNKIVNNLDKVLAYMEAHPLYIQKKPFTITKPGITKEMLKNDDVVFMLNAAGIDYKIISDGKVIDECHFGFAASL